MVNVKSGIFLDGSACVRNARWRKAFGKSAGSRSGGDASSAPPRRTTAIRPVAGDGDAAGIGPAGGRASEPYGAQAGGPALSPPGAEVMVLRAGLEDCLCHLVELYGPDVLDSFLERRLRRNIAPILAQAEKMEPGPQASRIRAHAAAAERLLREAVESVRKDPTPPPG